MNNLTAPAWEHFSHAADIGIRGIGKTLAESFEMAAMALTGVITDPNKVAPKEQIDITCQAPDREILLVDWLNAIIYQMDTRQLLFSQFHVTLKGLHLTAQIKGEPVNRTQHQPAVEIKGATYTALKVAKEGNYWVAQCVVDV